MWKSKITLFHFIEKNQEKNRETIIYIQAKQCKTPFVLTNFFTILFFFLFQDASQLVKANSITGNKMNDIDIVYTMWSNLKKTDGMVAGQVGFHKDKEVRKIKISKRENVIVNRLNKTKTEVKDPDLRGERENRDKNEREEKKKIYKQVEEQKREEEKKRKEEAEMRSYDRIFTEDKMATNKDGGNDSDDFMWK